MTRTIWPDIPRAPLLAALVANGVSVARSDEPEKADGKYFIRAARTSVETRIAI